MNKLLPLISLLLILAAPVAAAPPVHTGPELVDGYMSVVDENGVVILETGLAVHPGDQYITEDDQLYEITAVDGTLARARRLGAEPAARLALPAAAAQAQAPVPGGAPAPPAAQPAGAPQQLIALYYTHSDESYIPTDGKATIRGDGGIFKVGDAMARRLVELGYAVENDQTRHDPHDANAYHRSRRTFKRLLEQGPATLFDIHRDSAPLRAYQTTIGGAPAAKMLLVVGRQNQNRQTATNYAKKIKAAADSKYRGLIRGIFIAHGNYNQDLSPRAMLLEVGTQYNSRDAAERSAALFADIVPLFLAPAAAGPTGPPAAGATDSENPPTGGYGRDILTILGALLAGVAAFLLISTGSWRETKRKLARFRKFEFINFLGPRKKRRRD